MILKFTKVSTRARLVTTLDVHWPIKHANFGNVRRSSLRAVGFCHRCSRCDRVALDVSAIHGNFIQFFGFVSHNNYIAVSSGVSAFHPFSVAIIWFGSLRCKSVRGSVGHSQRRSSASVGTFHLSGLPFATAQSSNKLFTIETCALCLNAYMYMYLEWNHYLRQFICV